MARGDSDDEILRNPIFELDRKGEQMEDTNAELYNEAVIKFNLTSKARAFITQTTGTLNWQQLWVEIETDRFFPVYQDTFRNVLGELERYRTKLLDLEESKPKYEFFSDKTVYWARLIYAILWTAAFVSWVIYTIYKGIQ